MILGIGYTGAVDNEFLREVAVFGFEVVEAGFDHLGYVLYDSLVCGGLGVHFARPLV